MPLPTDPGAEPFPHISHGPPFLSSGGDVYVVGRGNGAGELDEVHMMKATDPTTQASWAEQDAAGHPVAGISDPGYLSMWAEQIGDLIHVVTQQDGQASGMDNLYEVEYHRFDMSTDTWTTVNESVDTAPNIESETYGFDITGVSISVFSDNDSVIAFQDTAGTFMGVDFQRVSWVTRTAAGSYGTVTAFSVPDSDGSYFLGGAVVGASERVHFQFGWRNGDDSSDWDLYHQSLLVTTLDTMAVIVNSTTVNITRNGYPYSFDDGTVRIRWPRERATEGLTEYDSGANPSFSHDTSAHDDDARHQIPSGDDADQRAKAHIAGVYSPAFDEQFLVYSEEVTDDLHWDRNPSGAGWGTDTRHTDQLATIGVVACNVFLRDGSYKLAVLYQDSVSDFWHYDEIELGNPAADPIPEILSRPRQSFRTSPAHA